MLAMATLGKASENMEAGRLRPARLKGRGRPFSLDHITRDLELRGTARALRQTNAVLPSRTHPYSN